MEFTSLVLLLGFCYLHWTTAAPSKSGAKHQESRIKLCETHGTVESLSKLEVNETLDKNCIEVFESHHGKSVLDLRRLDLKKFNRNWYKSSNAKIIDFSNNLIADIKPELLNDFSMPMTILLNNNKITMIKNNIMENHHCMSLALSNNPIRAIEDDAFKNLCLNELDLSHSALTNLDFIRTLPIMIKNLIVTYNEMITDIPTGVFQNFRQLEVVNFENNEIQKIRKNTFSGIGNSKLRPHILLGRNKINLIEAGSFSHSYIRHLDLSANNISDHSLYDGAFNGSSIDLITLSGNFMESVPEFPDMAGEGYIDL